MVSNNRIKMPVGFWIGLGELGIDQYEVIRKAGLPITILSDYSITITQYLAIWRSYSDIISDIATGIINIVTNFDPAHYPPPILATYHSCNYRAALKSMSRYKQLCPPERLRIVEEKETCIIEVKWLDDDQFSPPMLIGITLAFILELGRRGTGKHLIAKSVEFSQQMGDRKVLENYFGCRVKIGEKHNCLILNRADLDLPFVSYNEELLEILTPVLNQFVDEKQRNISFMEKVEWLISHSLTVGRPDINVIAKELGMSGRTLQRRLADEDTSFNKLLIQVRHEKAKEYLLNSSLDIKEVAFMIGYEDQNSFFRAFRIWEGETPSNWRSEHLSKM